jgi:tetratricopeptide (TPR) repeat protein
MAISHILSRIAIVGNATKGNEKGYSLIYSNTTQRGMSGGPVLNNAYDYYLRGNDKDENGDYRGALADYDQSIVFNPNNSNAYSNCTRMKEGVLNDYQGALADYNQSIILELNNFNAYVNRARMKAESLNDNKGALADYNQAIVLNPRNADFYYARDWFKETSFNDRVGAIQDYCEQGKNWVLSDLIKMLQRLGA